MSSSRRFEEKNLQKTAALVHVHTPEPAVANSKGIQAGPVHLKVPEEASFFTKQERKIPIRDMYVERQGNAWNLSLDRERCAQEKSFLVLTITENQLFPHEVCLS
jgi:hypothetical protein